MRDSMAGILAQMNDLEFLSEQEVLLPILQTMGILAVTFLLANVVRFMLIHREFDQLFVVPWRPLREKLRAQLWTPTQLFFRALLITGSVIAGFYLFGCFQNQFLLLESSVIYLSKAWLLLLTLFFAFATARFITAAVLKIFSNASVRQQLEHLCPHNILSGQPQTADRETLTADVDSAVDKRNENTDGSSESMADTIARLTGMLLYLLIILPIMMLGAQLWGWTTTASTLSQIWAALIPVIGLILPVIIGWLILTILIINLFPDQFQTLVLTCTMIGALALVMICYNTAIAIVFAICLLVLAWFTRQELPDIFAGCYLQTQQKLAVKVLDGIAVVNRTELLTSQLTSINHRYRVRNRHLLKSYLDGDTIDPSRLVEIPTETVNLA